MIKVLFKVYEYDKCIDNIEKTFDTEEQALEYIKQEETYKKWLVVDKVERTIK